VYAKQKFSWLKARCSAFHCRF